MVKISTVIQIIFAEKFVSQDFTIRAAPGLSGPTNTCGGRIMESVNPELRPLPSKMGALGMTQCSFIRIQQEGGFPANSK